MKLDLSRPRQKSLEIDLRGGKVLELILRRVKLAESAAFDKKIETLTEKMHKKQINGVKYSLDLLKLRCEPFDETLLSDLYEDELTQILVKLGELQGAPYPETPEKKS